MADEKNTNPAAADVKPAVTAATGPGMPATDPIAPVSATPGRTEAVLTDPPSNSGDADTPATKTLIDLEAELFGPHPVRIRGRIERGSGSAYQRLLPEQRAHYDAVEKLVEAEAALEAAQTTVGQAESALAEQRERVKAAADVAAKSREEAAQQKRKAEEQARAQADFEKANAGTV